MSYMTRDWVEIRREVASLRSRASTLYLRQLSELEARLNARGDTTMSDKGVWIAGHNMPGCLPESEPAGFETFDEAKQYMIDMMDRVGDDAFAAGDAERGKDGQAFAAFMDEADELSAVMEDLNLTSEGEWGTIVGNTSYWITYDADQSVKDFEDEL